MTDQYTLNEHTPVPCNDLLEWARWFEKADRRVAQNMIGDVCVSTVFLGIDHRFGGLGLPLLFETMIFGGIHDQYQDRCSTWEEAEKMHSDAVALVRKSMQ